MQYKNVYQNVKVEKVSKLNLISYAKLDLVNPPDSISDFLSSVSSFSEFLQLVQIKHILPTQEKDPKYATHTLRKSQKLQLLLRNSRHQKVTSDLQIFPIRFIGRCKKISIKIEKEHRKKPEYNLKLFFYSFYQQKGSQERLRIYLDGCWRIRFREVYVDQFYVSNRCIQPTSTWSISKG